jgi:galactokinase
VTDPALLSADFQRTFGRAPRVFRAPGRINLIGEHTDYNDGFVMPVALERATWVAAAPRSDRLVLARSSQASGDAIVDLDEPHDGRTGQWSDYVAGVAAVLSRSARLTGADLLIRSDVPVGAGLSSSAALEVAVGYALLTISDEAVDLTSLARACQQAEHEFVGTRCGMMDQFIACHAHEGSALLLDTRSLAAEWRPLPADVSVLACNTMVTHRLAAAEYNTRREDCEAGVRLLAQRFPHVVALRDVTAADLESAADLLPERVFRRCRHVVLENARVLEAGESLHAGDLRRFGRLMQASHESLRTDYEVSCDELDVMVRVAASIPGVYGARMTGGGFGGCVVALVDSSVAAGVSTRIRDGYLAETGLHPDVWVSAAGRGVTAWPD